MKSDSIHIDIAGRQWQQETLQRAMAAFGKRAKKFTTVAAPGAGKTRFYFALAKAMFQADMIDAVITVAPQAALATQAVKDAEQYGLTGVNASMYKNVGAFAGDLKNRSKDNMPVFLMTYSALTMKSIAPALNHYVTGNRVLVVFDEIHHMAENRTWGVRAKQAFKRTSYMLLMTGTPFREDGSTIPFVDYRDFDDEEWAEFTADGRFSFLDRDLYKMVISDGGITYRDAINPAENQNQYVQDDGSILKVNEQICAPATFWRWNGTVTLCDEEGLEIQRSMDEMGLNEAPATEQRALLTKFFDPESDYTRRMLIAAYEKLNDQIDSGHMNDNAGMLVVADSIAHAQRCADIMEEEFGIVPRIVHNKTPNPVDTIQAFKDGDDPVIVSVKMFAEGVDAPRVRVIAYLSRIGTHMFLRQVLGRGVRRVPGGDMAWCQFFLPALPMFDEIAQVIESELPSESKDESRICPHCERMEVVPVPVENDEEHIVMFEKKSTPEECTTYMFDPVCGGEWNHREFMKCPSCERCDHAPRFERLHEFDDETGRMRRWLRDPDCGAEWGHKVDDSDDDIVDSDSYRDGFTSAERMTSEEFTCRAERVINQNGLQDRVSPEVFALVAQYITADPDFLRERGINPDDDFYSKETTDD